MRTSKLFFTFKSKKDFLSNMGLNSKINEGFYSYNYLGNMILEKIISIVENKLKENNILKVKMPLVQKHVFKDKKKFLNEVYKLEGKNLVLNPTCEEMFIEFFDKDAFENKTKELSLFQTERKFRNEKRVISFIKTREFIMCDTYSFCINKKECVKNFKRITDIYDSIFRKMKIKFKKIRKVDKNIDSKKTIEYVTYIDKQKIEIAHCFNIEKLYKTKNYLNCFGIGISRLYFVFVKNMSKKNKNFLKILGKEFVIIPTNLKDKDIKNYSEYIYNITKKKCILDDRCIDFKKKIENFKSLNAKIIILSKFCFKNKLLTILKKKKKIDIKLSKFISSYIF